MKIETRKTVASLLHSAERLEANMSRPTHKSGMLNENATAKKIFSVMKHLGPTLAVKQTCTAFSKACKMDMPGLWSANDSHNLVVKEYPVYLKHEERRARHDFAILLSDGRKVAIETKAANVGTSMIEQSSTDVFQRFMQSDCDLFIFSIGGEQSLHACYQANRKLNAFRKSVAGTPRAKKLEKIYVCTVDDLNSTIALAVNA